MGRERFCAIDYNGVPPDREKFCAIDYNGVPPDRGKRQGGHPLAIPLSLPLRKGEVVGRERFCAIDYNGVPPDRGKRQGGHPLAPPFQRGRLSEEARPLWTTQNGVKDNFRQGLFAPKREYLTILVRAWGNDPRLIFFQHPASFCCQLVRSASVGLLNSTIYSGKCRIFPADIQPPHRDGLRNTGVNSCRFCVSSLRSEPRLKNDLSTSHS